jgi:protein gp37
MSGAGKFWTASHSQAIGCAPCDETCEECWAATLVDRMGHNPSMAALFDASDGLTEVTGEGMWAKARFTGRVLVRADRIALNRVLAQRRSQVLAVNWLGDLGYKGTPVEVVWDLLDALLEHSNRCAVKMRPRWAYLFLTHRPHEFARRVQEWALNRWGRWGRILELSNSPAIFGDFWWGATVTHQAALAPALELGALPGHHWLCCEPMSGPISPWRDTQLQDATYQAPLIDWIVAGWYSTRRGGEEFRRSWFPALRDECGAAGIPLWGKATGSRQVDALMPREMPEVVRAAFEGAKKERTP